MKKSWHLDRRTFLRGAGLTLALPFLEGAIHANQPRPNQRPRRLACVFFPNGAAFNPRPENAEYHWQPQTGVGRDYRLSRSLEPLAPFREQMTVFGNMHHLRSKGIGSHVACDVWLTGANIRGTYDQTVSIDQRYVREVGRETRFPSLVLSGQGGTGHRTCSRTLSYNANGQPIPTENVPRRVFERFFGADGSEAAQRLAYARQHSVLDFFQENSRSLSANLDASDRRRLDEYLDGVREIESRVTRAEQWLDRPRPRVDANTLRLDIDERAPREFIRVMYDLIYWAFQTDSCRAATYELYAEGGCGGIQDSYPRIALGIRQTHHALSHDSHGPTVAAELARYDRWLIEQLAYFLDRLASTREGDGTLLDRTLVLYGSATGQVHRAENYALLLAGGRGLGVRGGQYLKFAQERAMSDLLLTMLHRLGVETPRFGESTRELTEIVA